MPVLLLFILTLPKQVL